MHAIHHGCEEDRRKQHLVSGDTARTLPCFGVQPLDYFSCCEIACNRHTTTMAETATDASAHLQLAAQDLPHAEVIWDYHNLGQSLEGVKADFIFALGSHDLRVAERAAELYLAGHAPHVLLSGGLGNFTEVRARNSLIFSGSTLETRHALFPDHVRLRLCCNRRAQSAPVLQPTRAGCIQEARSTAV